MFTQSGGQVEDVEFPAEDALRSDWACRANSAHVRQSRADSGLGHQAKVLRTFKAVPSSLGSGLLYSTRCLLKVVGRWRAWSYRQRTRVEC